jgi:putative peptide zinc metalloprotease protein
MRKVALLAVLALAGLGFGAPSAARADDNTAVVINTKDGASIFKFAFKIRKIGGDVVDETNAAVAYSSCTSCQTVAIAIEIVLVTGNPSVVTPTNVAIAINDQCTLCVSVADAYQWVISVPADFRFSHDALRQIKEIVQAIHDLGKSGLSAAEIQARLEKLVKDLAKVIADDIQAGGAGANDQSGDENDTTTEPAAPPPQSSSTETTTTTSEPTTATETSTGTETTTTTTTGSTTTTP